MKLRMKRKAMVVLAAGMLMSAAAPAAAMAAEKATGPALTASYNRDAKYTGGGEGCNAADCGDWQPPGSGEEPSGLV